MTDDRYTQGKQCHRCQHPITDSNHHGFCPAHSRAGAANENKVKKP